MIGDIVSALPETALVSAVTAANPVIGAGLGTSLSVGHGHSRTIENGGTEVNANAVGFADGLSSMLTGAAGDKVKTILSPKAAGKPVFDAVVAAGEGIAQKVQQTVTDKAVYDESLVLDPRRPDSSIGTPVLIKEAREAIASNLFERYFSDPSAFEQFIKLIMNK